MSVTWRQFFDGVPTKSFWRWLWYQSMRTVCWVWFKVCYRYRVIGPSRPPLTGPVLLVSNHESVLDPIIMGLSTGVRPAYKLARSTFASNRFLLALMRSLFTLFIDRGEADIKSMRRCIEVMKDEGAMLGIFPEGTRSLDGSMKPFEPGLMLMIRRAKPMVVPLAMEGALEAWPAGRKFPHLFGRIVTMWGEPIPAEKLLAMGTEAALAHLHAEVKRMRDEITLKAGDAVKRAEL